MAHVPVKFVNVGKGVVYRAHIYFIFEVDDSSKAPTFRPSQSDHDTMEATLMYPGDDSGVATAFIWDGETPRRLTESEINQLTKGDSYLSIFGQIVYTDKFGAHWARFCQWKAYPGPDVVVKESSINALSCTTYNSVGDGSPPS